MENNKLNKIHKILRIILIVFILFSMIKSCSYAYTWEDFNEFIEQNNTKGNYSYNTNIQKAVSDYLQDLSGLNTYFLNANININSYEQFILSYTNNYTKKYALYILPGDATYNITGTNATTIYKGQNNYYQVYHSTNYGSNEKTSNLNVSITTGLMYTNPTGADYKNMIYQNYYNYFDLLGAENRDTNLLPWYFANAKVGLQYYDYNITFKLYDTNDNFILYLNADNDTLVNGGHLYQLEIPYLSWQGNSIINGDYYYVVYNNNTNDIFKSNNFRISWQRTTENDANIMNPSGEITGSIDLTETNNKIDNVAKKVEENTEQLKAMESGEIQRNNFWKETYNALFTLDSGDIKDLSTQIEEKMQELTSGDSPYGEEATILNMIAETEPADLIISWEAIQYKDKEIIPSGEINFNEIVREFKLTELHETIQLIITASLVFLLYKAIWKCIVITLGIGTEMYEDMEEEKKALEPQMITNEYIDKNGSSYETTTTIHKLGRNRKHILHWRSK